MDFYSLSIAIRSKAGNSCDFMQVIEVYEKVFYQEKIHRKLFLLGAIVSRFGVDAKD